jgi:hypothetical protein
VQTAAPPAHAGSSLPDFSTVKMETIRSSETSVYTSSIRRHIPEDGILQHFILLYFSDGKIFSPLSSYIYHIIYLFTDQGGGIVLELSREGRLRV